MKIIVSKSSFMESINIVLRAVPAKTTMNILSCILIDASVDNIVLTANDMELGIETVTEGTIAQRGILCLDAKLLADIVRKLPDYEITIESDEDYNTKIICMKSVFKIAGKDPQQFPSLNYIERENPVTLSHLQFREIIRQTIFSISPNDQNKVLNGECLRIRGNELRLVALDGHRIAMRYLTLDKNYDDMEVIIPGKALSELMKTLSGEQDRLVKIYFSKNEILFEMDSTIMISRLVDGSYIHVDQMLSNDFETRLIMKRSELINCMERSLLFTSESEKRPLILNIENDNLNLAIMSPMGSFSEDIDVMVSGKDLRIGFNPKFILDALRVIDDDTVNIYFMNTRAPLFIKDDDLAYIYIILPVNII